MIDVLRREWIYLWYYITVQFQQIAPYYALGMALGSLLSVFAKTRIHGLFASMGNKKLGLLGVIPASLLGIASPLCMYGAIPLAASFSRFGIPVHRHAVVRRGSAATQCIFTLTVPD